MDHHSPTSCSSPLRDSKDPESPRSTPPTTPLSTPPASEPESPTDERVSLTNKSTDGKDITVTTLDVKEEKSSKSSASSSSSSSSSLASPKSLPHVPPLLSMDSIMTALRGLVIEVEGNIGSGKSTLTSRMTSMINDVPTHGDGDGGAIVHGEKVNTTFLGAFYGNTKRYGFAFQMYMLTTRLYQMEESARQAKSESKLVFLDRGAVGDTLFAIQNYKLGNMDDEEMGVYRSVCKERLPASLSDKVDMLLYLDVEPVECHRRMNALRKREAESGVPLSYLEGIDSCYFYLLVNWLGARKDGLHDMNIGKAPPIVVMPWNTFGKTEYVLHMLRQLREGTRRSPMVVFSTEKPVSKDIRVFDTSEQLSEAYVDYQLSLYPKMGAHAAFNWDLPHDNVFKRVVMSYLYVVGLVVLYGKSTNRVETLSRPPPAACRCSTTTTTTPPPEPAPPSRSSPRSPPAHLEMAPPTPSAPSLLTSTKPSLSLA